MRLFDHWSHTPPLHLSVARYLGYKPKVKSNRSNFAEAAKIMRGANRVPRGAKTVDHAPLYIQKMIMDAKKQAAERKQQNG